MASFFRAMCLAILASMAGCSTDTAKRTAYETLQNVHQQECLKNPSASNCEKRESYDDYQRRRKELDPSK